MSERNSLRNTSMYCISMLLQREARMSINCHLLHSVSLFRSTNVKQQFEENLAEQVKVSLTVNGYNNLNNTVDVVTQRFEGNSVAPFSTEFIICQTNERKHIKSVQQDHALVYLKDISSIEFLHSSYFAQHT